MDSSDLGFGVVPLAIIGTLVGLLAAGLVVAGIASWMGGQHFGPMSVCLGLVVALAVAVDLVVIWRTIGGEVTGWDLVWAAGLTVAGGWSLRRLAASSARPPRAA
jgi:hypothetical protein